MMNTTELVAYLHQSLHHLQIEYERRYGIAIFNVTCHLEPSLSTIVVNGYVLLPYQSKAVETAITYPHWHIRNQLVVISDSATDINESWIQAKRDVVSMYQHFGILDRQRYESCHNNISSQITPHDRPCRVLNSQQNWSLIQADDFTLGWVSTSHCKSLVSVCNPWGSIQRPKIGHIMDVEQNVLSQDFRPCAYSYLETPYFAGGTTKWGIDCSGLVQRIYREIFSLVLPKHSLDQKQLGMAIPLEELQMGDLIFLLRPARIDPSHVGLYLGDNIVISARFQQHRRVVLETLDEFIMPTSIHDQVEARRLVASFQQYE